MFILGYSGLSQSAEYRKNSIQQWPDADPNEYQGMDAAAVLIRDGEIIAAAEEERFVGVKHTHQFPINAINFCLQQAQITVEHVEAITHGFNYMPVKDFLLNEKYMRGFYQQVADPNLQKEQLETYFPGAKLGQKLVSVTHHDAHAASAFYPSPFEQALVLVADGIGELHSISVYQGEGNKLTLLKNYDFLSSLGMFYSLITSHLGFKVNSGEYKVMGLAPYGDPSRFSDFMQECIELQDNGGVFIKAFLKDKLAEDKIHHHGFFTWLSEQTGIAKVEPETELSQEHKDLAAALQQRLNQAVLHIVRYWQQQTNAEYFCYAGGVALNCTTNGEILRTGLFKDIYIQPASHDAGTALGSALYHYFQTLQQTRRIRDKELPFYGPHLSRHSKLEVLDSNRSKLHYIELSDEELYQQAAQMLAEGKVIAWMQDNMEFGPRALGNRSILADARNPEMRDKLNNIVKKREGFRPFAPSVKLTAAAKYFEVDECREFPYMLFTVPVREEYRQLLPATTHVDGSSRLQTVAESHKKYWKLLDQFEKITGVPIVLNTSFNVRGQPMVCNIAHGISTLLNTNIDALFVDNFKVIKDLD